MTFYDLSNDDVLNNKHYNTHYHIKEEIFINDLNIYDVFQAINFCKTQVRNFRNLLAIFKSHAIIRKYIKERYFKK